ncbi:MAG: S8/S53 family peptidase [Myxococcota bacterium]
MMRSLLLGVLLVGGCMAEVAGPQEDEVGATSLASRGRTGRTPPRTRPRPPDPPKARPCRDDSFFVEVPLHVDPPWKAGLFERNLAAALAPDVNASGYPWFCGVDQVTCPTSSVDVRVEALLPERSSPEHRDDGHLRFYRVHFESAERRLRVRPGAWCAVVDQLQTELTTYLAPEEVYVGRECDSMALGIEDQATEEMLSWHLSRVGLPTNRNTTPPTKPLVDIALIDTGVDPAVAATIGIASHADFSEGGPVHAHGPGMALLLRQVSDAAIHSIRVFDSAGNARSGALSQGLDHVLFSDPAARRPLIVNLSAGFSGELADHAVLTGDNGCETLEEPVGESVRYGLEQARQLSASGARQVFVSAAAGNRPGRVDPSLFSPTTASVYDCGTPDPAGTPWFLPAWWHHLDSCSADPGSHRLALGVGSVNDRDQPSLLGIPDRQPALVAPGVHVYADHPLLSGTPSAPLCLPGTSSFPVPVEFPKTFTGSSVSAALVSAAAARVQTHQASLGSETFNQTSLARLIYLTGDAVCDRGTPLSSAFGAPVRRLNVARLTHALRTEECRSLVDCARADLGEDPIPPNLVTQCELALVQCGLGRYNDDETFNPGCGNHEDIDWPSGYGPAVCASSLESTPFGDANSCGSGGCPYEAQPFPTAIGSLGPQPGDGGCPECALEVVSAALVRLRLEINHEFPSNTIFSNPYLYVRASLLGQSSYGKFFAPLPNIEGSIHPGAYLEVTVPINGVPGTIDWGTAQAQLIMEYEIDGSMPAMDYSPLRIE